MRDDFCAVTMMRDAAALLQSDRITGGDLAEMYLGYYGAMEFTDRSEPDDGQATWDAAEPSRELMARLVAECTAFAHDAYPWLAPALETDSVTWSQVGHDFHLSRNGHGAGFFDRPGMYGQQDVCDLLQRLAESYGPRDSYVGDDGRVYW